MSTFRKTAITIKDIDITQRETFDYENVEVPQYYEGEIRKKTPTNSGNSNKSCEKYLLEYYVHGNKFQPKFEHVLMMNAQYLLGKQLML